MDAQEWEACEADDLTSTRHMMTQIVGGYFRSWDWKSAASRLLATQVSLLKVSLRIPGGFIRNSQWERSHITDVDDRELSKEGQQIRAS